MQSLVRTVAAATLLGASVLSAASAAAPAPDAEPVATRAPVMVAGLWCGAGLLHNYVLEIAQEYQRVEARLIKRGRVQELTGQMDGPILRADRVGVTPIMRAWSVDPNPWLRRTSIICQLTFKAETDRDLLTEVIEANVADKGFFLRTAIGWALRQYARTDPAWVRAYVADHDGELSGLSKREALKNIT